MNDVPGFEYLAVHLEYTAYDHCDLIGDLVDVLLLCVAGLVVAYHEFKIFCADDAGIKIANDPPACEVFESVFFHGTM